MKKETRITVWNKYKGHCAYCGEYLEFSKMQVDHIDPKYLGGKDDLGNYNPSCRQCNFYKSTFDIEGFRDRLTTMIERVKKPFIVRLAIKYKIISFNTNPIVFHYETINKQL